MTTPTGQAVDLSAALESAFREVIETMFGLTIEGPGELPSPAGLSLNALIGLAGPVFRGMLCVSCTGDGARTLAATLLGGEDMLGDDPSMVTDSLGELANMIAGAVKRQLDSSGSRIDLSLPSVMDGEATIHGIGGTGDATLAWTVEGSPVLTSLVYSEQEP